MAYCPWHLQCLSTIADGPKRRTGSSVHSHASRRSREFAGGDRVACPPISYNGGVTKQEIILANQECLFPAVFHYFREPLVLTKAKDQYVWDADGNQYLDFFGGILTVSVGHCNEKVNRAVHAQVDKLQHVSTVFPTEPQAALARKISDHRTRERLEIVLHDQRHGSQRNGDSGGALFHRVVRDHCAAAFLSRAVVAGDGADRAIDLEVGPAGASRDHVRAQRLLLSLPVRA